MKNKIFKKVVEWRFRNNNELNDVNDMCNIPLGISPIKSFFYLIWSACIDIVLAFIVISTGYFVLKKEVYYKKENVK